MDRLAPEKFLGGSTPRAYVSHRSSKIQRSLETTRKTRPGNRTFPEVGNSRGDYAHDSISRRFGRLPGRGLARDGIATEA